MLYFYKIQQHFFEIAVHKNEKKKVKDSESYQTLTEGHLKKDYALKLHFDIGA